MPPPLVPDDPGLLASILDTASLGGSAVRNLLRGNFAGAGRNLVDVGGRAIDAVIPGDWIPDVSGPGDRPEFRDVVDLGGDNAFTDTLNFLGDVATDPVSYIPGAAIAKAGTLGAKGVAKGVSLLPKTVREPLVKGAANIGQKTRATFGAQRVSPGTEQALAAKGAAEGLVGRAGSEGAVDALGGLSERELNALGEVGHNMRLDPATGRPVRVLDESGALGFDERLQKLLNEDPSLDPARLLAAAPKAREAFKTQWDSGLAPASEPGGGIYYDNPSPGTPDVVMGGMKESPGAGIKDYFPMQFSGLKEDEIDLLTGLPKNLGRAPDLAGIPAPIKERADWGPQDILDYLNKNPNVNLEFNAAKAMAARASAQGELAGRAQVGQSLFDMAKAGQVDLPDELLQKFVARTRPSGAVVGASNAGGDVSRLLGGDTTGRAADLMGLGERSGTSVVPSTGEIIPRSPNADLLGEQSGKAIAPATPEIEQLASDIYGIGSQSGKAKPPGKLVAEDAGQGSLDLYGLGSLSGKSRPPVATPIEPSVADLLGIGSQSGKSVVGSSTGGEAIDRSLAELGLGGNSGKSVVGPSVAGQEVPIGLRQLGAGEQTGKSVVGKSTAPTVKGITDEERARAKEYVLSQPFKYADPELRSAAQHIARQFPAEEARVLLDALDGMTPRGGAASVLAKLNPYFKGPAVYGAIVPKLGSIMRNGTGGLFQQLANANARGDLPRAAKALVPNFLKSVNDGVEHLFGTRIGKNEFTEVDNAFKTSGGDPRKALNSIKDPTMRSAVARGVLGNNFINTEAMVKATTDGGWKAFGKKLWEYPAVMFKGMEQRMRYGLYKSQIAKGVPEDQAAKTVSDTFYDYRVSSTENRLARDVIPFFQFTAKAVPQQGKFLAENPLALSAMANLSGGSRGEALPPYLEGKINIPFGRDEQGNKQVISNLGLPVEALGWLPNPSADLSQVGRQLEQNQVGSSHPLLKTLFSTVSGEDPYFGTPYGSYSKVGGVDLGKPGAALNQLLGTGLPGASALSGALGFGSKVTDDRTSTGEKLANLLTGAKIASIDPDVALRQKLQEYLANNPNISQFRSFYQTDKTDEGQALIHELQQAKKRIKDKKADIVPVN